MNKQLLVVLALGACAALAQGQMMLYEDFEDYEVGESIHFQGTDTTEWWGEVPRWYGQINSQTLADHGWSRVLEFGGNKLLEMQARTPAGTTGGAATAMSMESVQITGEGTLYLRYAVNQVFGNRMLTNDLEPGWDYGENASENPGMLNAVGWQGGLGVGPTSYAMHGAIPNLGGGIPFNARAGAAGYLDDDSGYTPPVRTWMELWLQVDAANHRNRYFICEQGGEPVMMTHSGGEEWWGWRNDGWTNNAVKNLKFILSHYTPAGFDPYTEANTIYLDTIGVDAEAWTLDRVGPDTLPDIWGEDPVCIPGDANCDGVVDLDDFVLLKTNFGRDDEDVAWEHGDFNEDGVVDLDDFVILKTNFGATAAAVPEPMTLSLLALGGLALIRRRS